MEMEYNPQAHASPEALHMYLERNRDSSTKIEATREPQIISVSRNFLKWDLPNRFIFAGPSQTGKTELMCSLLQHRDKLFTKDWEDVFYCLPQQEPDTDDREIFEKRLKQLHPQIEVHHGILNREEMLGKFDGPGEKLLILDDLMDLVSPFYLRRSRKV